jgi:hypothetical protein
MSHGAHELNTRTIAMCVSTIYCQCVATSRALFPTLQGCTSERGQMLSSVGRDASQSVSNEDARWTNGLVRVDPQSTGCMCYTGANNMLCNRIPIPDVYSILPIMCSSSVLIASTVYRTGGCGDGALDSWPGDVVGARSQSQIPFSP